MLHIYNQVYYKHLPKHHLHPIRPFQLFVALRRPFKPPSTDPYSPPPPTAVFCPISALKSLFILATCNEHTPLHPSHTSHSLNMYAGAFERVGMWCSQSPSTIEIKIMSLDCKLGTMPAKRDQAFTKENKTSPRKCLIYSCSCFRFDERGIVIAMKHQREMIARGAGSWLAGYATKTGNLA